MNRSAIMQLALDEAWKYQGLTYPNPAVGAVVVDEKGAVLGVGGHQKAGGPHAEVWALKSAYQTLRGDHFIDDLDDAHAIHDFLQTHHNDCFAHCTIFVTLEPCSHFGKTPSCAQLITTLGLRQVIIGSCDTNPEAAGGKALLEAKQIEVIVGESKEQTDALLDPFIQWNAGRFLLFKWAQRLDGTVDGGTISSEESRRLVHAMRDRADLLVIGGNTVRTDRPTLDARLVNGKAPDILIISRSREFDRSIPLFNIEGRKVMIADTMDEVLESYNNVFIEGGPGMFRMVRPYKPAYLCFVAPTTGGSVRFTDEVVDLKVVHARRSGSDMMLWLKEQ
jgi:diaminohydroxyphosphoribosylaminopyrimidine deaminase/5-amino-6-(5-phosphoribosylamino)uracil reductase